MRGLKSILWEASVLDPNEVRYLLLPQPFLFSSSFPGYTLPRQDNTRVPEGTPASPGWKGDDCREYVVAPDDRSSPYPGAIARPIPRARGEGRAADYYYAPH